MKCPNCGTENDSTNITCKYCLIPFTPKVLAKIEKRNASKKNEPKRNITIVNNNVEKSSSGKAIAGLGLLLLGIILFFGGCAKIEDGRSTGMIIGFIMCLGSIILFTSHEIQQGKEDAQKMNAYHKENKIPYTAQEIKMYIGEYKVSYNIWKEGCNLNFANSYNTGQCSKKSIDIENIISYNIIGDAYTETNVIGGGSSLTGAVVGGVIAGGAGAVVGSRRGIRTENKRIDNRKTVITYNEDGTIKNIFFSPETYEILLRLIPEKDINFLKSNINPSASNQGKEDISNDAYNKIRELAKLKADGILTEEEFNSKKKILLAKI